MQDTEITVKDLKTNYKIFGQGNPMLILHGWGSNSERWEKVAELLEQKNLQLIIPDLPGFGKSDVPPVAWRLDNYVDWLSEFVEKLPELKGGFCLLGHSFGGALAAKFAIRYNQKVKKLFLVSAACVRKNTGVKKVYYRFAKMMKIFKFLPFYDLMRKAAYKYIIRKSDYVYQDGIMKDTYLNVILEDLTYKVSFLKVPVVMIWGDKDESTPMDQAELLHKKIFNSKLAVIKDAGHALNANMPGILSDNILANI